MFHKKIFSNKKFRYKGLITRIYKTITLSYDPGPLFYNSEEFQKKNVFIITGGKKNPDKVFYVIKRSPGYGLFSNVLFVLNHIRTAKKFNFIPIVDMQNYTTLYNEKKKICNTFNSWEYYFEQISNYTLKEVYESQNIIITNNTYYTNLDFETDISKSFELLELFKSNILIKKNKFKLIKYLKRKLFKNQKILGVHFRGSHYKGCAPFTKEKIIQKIKEVNSKNDYDKIFIVTEDSNNLKHILNEFKDKVIYLKNTFRSKYSEDIWNSKLPNIRYRFGRDTLVQTALLSFCDAFIDIKTNPAQAVMAFNLNPVQKRFIENLNFKSKFSISDFFIYFIRLIKQ
jgi:hypothetical protein